MESSSYYNLTGDNSPVTELWNSTFNEQLIPDDSNTVSPKTGSPTNLSFGVDAAGVGGVNGTMMYAIRDPLWIVIPISVIYSTIFVVGVLGNVITCIVISRNKSMHTATNYYLFSLAISDLLLLLTGVPQELYLTWYRFPYPFGTVVCKMVGFAAETSANATVLTITAFTVERYVAICKPFLSHTMSKLSRAVRFVLAIWLIALSMAVPQAFAMEIDQQFLTCTVRHEQTKHVFFISTMLVFVFPMSIITIFYVLIWLQLRRSKVVRCGTQRSSSIRLKHSIFKRSSHRTVITLHGDRTSSPAHHYSESTLIAPTQQPRPADALRVGQSSPLHHVSSCPATPDRKDRQPDRDQGGLTRSRGTHHHHRTQSLAQYRHVAGGSPPVGPRADSVGGSHQQLEQQVSVGSEDGRINYSNRTQYNSTRHVVKMLVAVVIAFFLCWAPFHAQRLMAVYANEHNQNAAIRTAFEVLTYVSGIFYYVSTCINPVLYNIMSHKFREAFKATLSNYFYPRSSQPLSEDLFFRNASWRSNSNNSHSLNTCSSVCVCSSTLHLPDGSGTCRRCSSMVPLRCLRRPLVVSFRTRPKVPESPGRTPVPRWRDPTAAVPAAAADTEADGPPTDRARPQRNDPDRSHPTDNEPALESRKVDDLCFTGQKDGLQRYRRPDSGIPGRPEVDDGRCGPDRPSVPCQYDLYPQLRCIYPSTDEDSSCQTGGQTRAHSSDSTQPDRSRTYATVSSPERNGTVGDGC